VEVDRCRPDLIEPERLDHDASAGDLVEDHVAREDHGRRP